MMTRPALRKALEFIADGVNARRFTADGPLPVVKTLARDCGVSAMTMVRALKVCREQGLIAGSQGGRLRVIVPQVADPEELARLADAGREKRPAWQRVRSAIHQDILRGVHDPDTSLGSLKTLGHRYGASYQVLRKALEALAGEGLLALRRKSYHTVSLARGRSRATIVLIGPAGPDGNFSFVEHSKAFMHLLEQECAHRRVCLRPAFHFHEEQTGHQKAFALPVDDSILGYVFIISGYQGDEELRRREVVLRDLSHVRKPVAVVATRETPEQPAVPHGTNVRFFQIGLSARAGERVGRFLLELGHRRVCFLSMFHRESWSQNRLAGIVSTFAAAGLHDAVAPVVIDYPTSFRQPPEQATVIAAWKKMVRSFDTWRKSVPADYAAAVDQVIRIDIPRKHLPGIAFRDGLGALFEQALADVDATAWVLVNDSMAIAAARFLKERGVAVPGRISLVGFDDSIAALDAGITSYNFDPGALESLVLNYITSPRHVRARFPGEADGFVVERGSTCAATNPKKPSGMTGGCATRV